jgi:ABC-type dipeptide/oligopeptide/nickel transport system permease component
MRWVICDSRKESWARLDSSWNHKIIMKTKPTAAIVGLILNVFCLVLVTYAVLRYHQEWVQFRPEVRAANAEKLLRVLHYGILPMHGLVALLSAAFFWILRK